MSNSYYFAVVGHNDNPIFEMDFVAQNKDVKVTFNLPQLGFLIEFIKFFAEGGP